MRMKQTTVEGKVVRVGDVVGVKRDFETAGEIVAINMGDWGTDILTLENEDGFYQPAFFDVPAEKCWIL